MIPKIRKAIAGAVATALGALGTALLDGDLTQAETLASLGAGLVAGYAVWQIKNRD
jgi:hypothetical protein